jgi:hypothetical protein
MTLSQPTRHLRSILRQRDRPRGPRASADAHRFEFELKLSSSQSVHLKFGTTSESFTTCVISRSSGSKFDSCKFAKSVSQELRFSASKHPIFLHFPRTEKNWTAAAGRGFSSAGPTAHFLPLSLFGSRFRPTSNQEPVTIN